MAGEQRQEWVWRDIFRSIGLAFSFSRLLAGFFGIALMVLVDGYITYFLEVYKSPGIEMDTMATFCGYARLGILGFIFLFTATAIAYSVKGELLDGEGAGAGESLGFAARRLGTILSTVLLFWVYIGVMAGFAIVFFLLPAQIMQWFGYVALVSLIWYAATYFFFFLFTVLAAIGFLAFLFSFFLAPPIIAVRQEGALVGRIFIVETFQAGYKASEIVLDKDFTKTVAHMPTKIQPRAKTIFYPTKRFWPKRAADTAPGNEIQHKISGWALGIWVLILAGFSVSFVMGAGVAAATLTYLIVREEEEFLEPAPVQAPVPTTTGPPEVEEKAKSEDSAKEKPEKGPKKQAKKKSKRESKKAKKSG
ncbi:MAG: hypothetical protein ACYSU0_08970 [Planctomycetota bacterium]